MLDGTYVRAREFVASTPDLQTRSAKLLAIALYEASYFSTPHVRRCWQSEFSGNSREHSKAVTLMLKRLSEYHVDGIPFFRRQKIELPVDLQIGKQAKFEWWNRDPVPDELYLNKICDKLTIRNPSSMPTWVYYRSRLTKCLSDELNGLFPPRIDPGPHAEPWTSGIVAEIALSEIHLNIALPNQVIAPMRRSSEFNIQVLPPSNGIASITQYGDDHQPALVCFARNITPHQMRLMFQFLQGVSIMSQKGSLSMLKNRVQDLPPFLCQIW